VKNDLQNVDDQSLIQAQNQATTLTSQMVDEMDATDRPALPSVGKGKRKPVKWKITKPEDNPQFANANDSGIACMMLANVMSMDMPALFTSDDMEHFRKRICFTFMLGDVV
jgi:hypothetical protein